MQVVFADEQAAELLSPALEALADPVRAGWETVKHSHSRTVYRGRVGPLCRWVYVKHFHVPSRTYRLRKLMGLSEALRELRAGQLLAQARVPAVRALACEDWGGREWVATLGERGEPADRWCRAQARRGLDALPAMRQAARRAGEVVALMHAAGLAHSDLRLSNLLVCESADAVRTGRGELEVLLIDLHRVRRRAPCARLRLRNLARLLHESRRLVRRTDRLRFFAAYLAAGAPRLERAQRRRMVRLWNDRIRLALARYERRELGRLDRMPLTDGRYFARLRIAEAGGWLARVVLQSRFVPANSRVGDKTFSREDWQAALGPLVAAAEKADHAAGQGELAARLRLGACELDVTVRRMCWRRRRLARVFRRLSPAEQEFRDAHRRLARGAQAPLALAMAHRVIDKCRAEGIVVYEATGCGAMDSGAGY